MKTRIVSVIIAFWFIWATAEALQVQSQTVRPPAPDSKFSDREAAQNAANNRNRLLIYVHGGGYVYNPGEAGTQEGTLMAAYGGFKVISVDYRMPPDYPYPAAMDDAMAVWKAALKMQSPANIAIFGTSTGGGMTLERSIH